MCRVQPCLPPSSEVALQQKSVELYATSLNDGPEKPKE